MTAPQPRQALLQFRFEGTAIRDGGILVDDLFQFVSNLHLAIERTIDVLEAGTSDRRGRRPKASQILAALEVVAMPSGSFGIALDLRRNGRQLLPGFDVGKKAIEIIVIGLSAIAPEAPLPKGFDRGVLTALRDASRILDRGIDTVHIKLETGIGPRIAEFTAATRERIVSKIKEFERAWAVVEGRLLMADVKEDSLCCRLHPSTGEAILCSFDESMTEQVVHNLRHFVQARGDATVDTSSNKIRSLVIRDLEQIVGPSETQATIIPSSVFWEARTFEELAAEQGIYPIEDWSQLSGEWPKDADFEAFLEAIQNVRRT